MEKTSTSKKPTEYKLKPKLFSVMKNYSKGQFANDLVAGVIVAIIALPLSIALALASGVRPEQGLYTAVAADKKKKLAKTNTACLGRFSTFFLCWEL